MPIGMLRFLVGQQLTLLVDIGGVTHRRCYSFSCVPAGDTRPSITVRRAPEGLVSRHLHATVRAGDTLLATEAAGEFTLPTDPSASRVVAFVAGGVGVTPLIGLVESLLRDKPASRAILVCGNRSEDEIIFRDRITALESRYAPRLVVRHALDAPPADWPGITGALDGGRVLGALGGTRADAYYVCGPEAMMQGVCEALDGAGVPGERIRTERFAYATVAKTLPTRPAEVTVASSGRRVTARPGLMKLAVVILGTFNPKDGLVDPNGVVMGYVTAGQRLGVNAQTEVEVFGVQVEKISAWLGLRPTKASIYTAGNQCRRSLGGNDWTDGQR